MGDTKHVCGASGFGLGLDDVCPACQAHNAEMAIKRETPAQAFERGRQLGMEQERALHELSKSSQEIEARRAPLTEPQAIKLWHENVDAHSRISAFEWFAAGLIAAERHHGIGTTPPAGESDTQS